MRYEKTPPARRYWAALIFIVLGTLAGIWHSRQVDRGKSDIISSIVRSVVTPPAMAVSSIFQWFGNQTSWVFHGRAAFEENRKLHARIAVLEGENASLHEAQINYERVREDLGFVRSSPQHLLPADVIARQPDPKFDTLLISVGSADGVKPSSVVVTRSGLVGRVIDVAPHSASVLMLTDQNSGVGARVQRAASRAVGICKGDNSRTISLVYLPNDVDIKVGDVIVTSGFGGVYPPGLVIGTVSEVRADEGNMPKTARVRPQVDFNRLEEVYVLK